VSLEQLREQVPGVLGLGEIPMADEPAEPQAEAGTAAGSSAVTTTDNLPEN
jgi:hypothetical protein